MAGNLRRRSMGNRDTAGRSNVLDVVRTGWLARVGVMAVVVACPVAAAFAAEVTAWKPKGISGPQFESHAAFDPLTGDFYLVRSSPAFEGWRIVVSRCGENGWSPPGDPVFTGDGLEADPFFAADGRALYFISSRSTDGVKRGDLDIWRVDRDGQGAWETPVRLPEPVNSKGAEWFPRPAPDGWLYFGSNRPGGLGGNDIWRARTREDGTWTVENLGSAINTAGDEYEPLLSPDGSRMILMADGDLFESKREAAGWSRRVKLPPEVNSGHLEIGAVFSPSGKSLLFSRDTAGPDSGEFYLLREGGEEAWPPECGAPPK
jgi:hypothetical protein